MFNKKLEIMQLKYQIFTKPLIIKYFIFKIYFLSSGAQIGYRVMRLHILSKESGVDYYRVSVTEQFKKDLKRNVMCGEYFC